MHREQEEEDEKLRSEKEQADREEAQTWSASFTTGEEIADKLEKIGSLQKTGVFSDQEAIDERSRVISKAADGHTHQDITEIQVAGKLSGALVVQLQEAFPGVTAVPNTNTTLLRWPEPEQARLIQLLQFLDEQGQSILDVGRRQAYLEEVFLSLTRVEQSNE